MTALSVAISIAGTAQAQSIANGSFEGGPAANGNQPVQVGDSTTIAGWTVVNNTNSPSGGGKEVAWLGDGAYGFNTPFGTDFLDLTGYSGSTGNSGVSQTVTTAIGSAYTLNFYLGQDKNAAPLSATLYVGTVPATIIDTNVNANGAILAGNTLWTPESYSFVATSEQTMLSIIGGTTTNDFIGLDNVSLTGGAIASGVPEAATWAMMILGMGAIGFAMRRQKVATRVFYSA